MTEPEAVTKEEELSFRVMHFAMIAGVLIFAGVTRWVVQPTAVPPMPMWVWLPIALAVPAFFVAGIVRGRLAPTATFQERQTHAIIIWALGEGVALFGIVAVFATGYWYPAGLGALIGLGLILLHRPGTFLDRPSGDGWRAGAGRRSGAGRR